MSRLTANSNCGNLVVFGLDNGLGWFCDTIDASANEIIDSNDGCSRGRLLEVLANTDVDSKYMEAIAMDLDPGSMD